ncbi:MAG: ankyrin repeat domain-containing protein [Bdellovibrionia bacterium]
MPIYVKKTSILPLVISFLTATSTFAVSNIDIRTGEDSRSIKFASPLVPFHRLSDETVMQILEKSDYKNLVKLRPPGRTFKPIPNDLALLKKDIADFYRDYPVDTVIWAVRRERIDLVKYFVKNLPSEQLSAKGEAEITPLHVAAETGQIEILEALLPKLTPKQINLPMRDGRTPLLLAVHQGRVEVVKELLSKLKPEEINRDFEIRSLPILRLERTPLGLAVKEDQVEVAKELIKGLPARELCKKVDGVSFLFMAVQKGRIEIMKAFFEKLDPTQINAKDDLGETLLSLAVSKKQKVEIVKAIVEALPPEQINASGNMGYTPLHVAAADGSTELVKILIGKLSPEQVNVKQRNSQSTPLHIAVSKGRIDVVRELIGKLTSKQLDESGILEKVKDLFVKKGLPIPEELRREGVTLQIRKKS